MNNNCGVTLFELLLFIVGMGIIALGMRCGFQAHQHITENGLKVVVESIWYGKGG